MDSSVEIMIVTAHDEHDLVPHVMLIENGHVTMDDRFTETIYKKLYQTIPDNATLVKVWEGGDTLRYTAQEFKQVASAYFNYSNFFTNTVH